MVNQYEHLNPDVSDAIRHAAKVVESLEYLALEAEQIGLTFSAHLIRTGACSVGDAIALATRAERNSDAA